MKKINKKILLTTIGGVASFAVITPIILISSLTINTTSTNTNSSNNNNTDGNTNNPSGNDKGGNTSGNTDGNTDEKNPGGDSGQGNQGGNTSGDNSGSDTNKKITPTLSSEMKLVGSFGDLISTDGSFKNVGELFTNRINNDETLKQKLITNYKDFTDEHKTNLNISIITPNQNNTWGGSQTYQTWSAKPNTQNVFYSYSSTKINFSSLSDLKTQLSDSNNLKTIMQQAGRTNANSNTYTLEADSKIWLDANKDYLSINIKETNAQGSTSTNLNLKLPVSDLSLVILGSKVTVSSNDPNLIEPITQDFTVNYDIGINSKVVLANTFVKGLILNYPYVEANQVVKEFGFVKSSSGQSVVLNNELIGQTTQVFNSVFTNPKLSTKSSDNKTSLSFDVVPASGYFWEDGTNTTRKISIDDLSITPGFTHTGSVPNELLNKTLDEFKNQLSNATILTNLQNSIKTSMTSDKNYPINPSAVTIDTQTVAKIGNSPILKASISDSNKSINLLIWLPNVALK